MGKTFTFFDFKLRAQPRKFRGKKINLHNLKSKAVTNWSAALTAMDVRKAPTVRICGLRVIKYFDSSV